MAEAFAGGCACGACRYGFPAATASVRGCTCETCQAATGGIFFARLQAPANRVDVSGPIGWFRSNLGLLHGYCDECGTHLLSHRESDGVMGVPQGTLDEPAEALATDHVREAARQQD